MRLVHAANLSANLNEHGSDNLQSKYDSALVLPVVGNVGPELSKDLVAGATLTDDLGNKHISDQKDQITGTGLTPPSYRA